MTIRNQGSLPQPQHVNTLFLQHLVLRSGRDVTGIRRYPFPWLFLMVAHGASSVIVEK